MITARATCFAGLKDLRGYIKCLLDGGSETYCYSKGDNGEGAWGDITATTETAMVAVPPSEMRKKWGSTKEARGKLVRLTVQGHKPITAEVRDKAPEGVIDLNPGALLALGLPLHTELNAPATWEWVT